MLTIPLVRCLKKQLYVEIHYLPKPAFAPILEANPYIDKVFSFQKEIPSDLVIGLKSERYDHIIDLHHNLRTLRLKLSLGRPSCSFDKLNWEKWLLVNFKIDRLPNIHIVHRYMKTVRHLGVIYDEAGLDYFIPETENLNNVELPKQAFVAFGLGATHATKRLPEVKIIEICPRIAQPIVLLGGNTDLESGARMSQPWGPRV